MSSGVSYKSVDGLCQRPLVSLDTELEVVSRDRISQFYEAMELAVQGNGDIALSVCEDYKDVIEHLRNTELSTEIVFHFFSLFLTLDIENNLFCRVLSTFHVLFFHRIHLLKPLVDVQFTQQLLARIPHLDFVSQTLLLDIVVKIATISSDALVLVYGLLERTDMPPELKSYMIYVWISHNSELKIRLSPKKCVKWAKKSIYSLPVCQENVRLIEPCVVGIRYFCDEKAFDFVSLRDFQERLREYLTLGSQSLANSTLLLLKKMVELGVEFCVDLDESLVQLLSDVDSQDIQENACTVLACFLRQRNSARLYVKLLSTGIAQHVSLLMQDGSVNVKRAALDLIDAFSRGPLVAVSHLLHFGVIPAVIDMLDIGDAAIERIGLKILRRMIDAAPRNGTTEALKEVFDSCLICERVAELTENKYTIKFKDAYQACFLTEHF